MVDAEGLCKRWEQVIRSAQLRAPPSTALALWTAYLRLRRTLFMTFKMQALQVRRTMCACRCAGQCVLPGFSF